MYSHKLNSEREQRMRYQDEDAVNLELCVEITIFDITNEIAQLIVDKLDELNDISQKYPDVLNISFR